MCRRGRPSAPWRYHFSPLGNPAPLFSHWRREGDEAGLASESQIASPIRRPFFYEDLQRYRNLDAPPARPDFTDLYGLPVPLAAGPPTGVSPESSLFIVRNGEPVLPAQDPNAPPEVFQPRIVCRDLDPWPAVQPVGSIIAVDVGDAAAWRSATASADDTTRWTCTTTTGSAPIWAADRTSAEVAGSSRTCSVRRCSWRRPAGGNSEHVPTLADALTEWAGAAVARPNAVITILDSRTYALPPMIT